MQCCDFRKNSAIDALAKATEEQFVDRVRRFLESKYPETAGLDVERGQHNARALIAKAKQFGLTSQSTIISFIALMLDYFVHKPEAFGWALDLLNDPDVKEEHKILGIEHRLYGVPLWNDTETLTPERMAQIVSDNAAAQRALVKRLQTLDDVIRTVDEKYGSSETVP